MTESGSTTREGELLDGRYRITEKIGTGGMATVYRGLDESLGRAVAIKLFRDGAADPADAQRKASETRILASLNHHALVTLFDARVSSGDDAYLVMEFVDGLTLSERIAEAPISPDDVAAMAIDLADALHVVHTAGIIHRDLKPSNVLLRPVTTPGPTFRAKLADFGIAYLVDSTRLTTPGALIGTAAYLSPEQVRGATPATPADVYALGLVLIESLTGKRVFPQTTLPEALLARLDHAPIVPGTVGYEWKSLLTAMTAQNPDERPTALDVAVAVRGMSGMAQEADSTEAFGAPTAVLASPAPTAVMERTAPTALMPQPTRTAVLPDHHDAVGAAVTSGTTGVTELLTPHTADVSLAPAARNPSRRRRLVLAVIVIAIVVIGIAIWVAVQASAPAPLADLPALPAPLDDHLQQLLDEVTP